MYGPDGRLRSQRVLSDVLPLRTLALGIAGVMGKEAQRGMQAMQLRMLHDIGAWTPAHAVSNLPGADQAEDIAEAMRLFSETVFRPIPGLPPARQAQN